MREEVYRVCTWTSKVCRIIAFYRFWAIILPTFGGLGKAQGLILLKTARVVEYVAAVVSVSRLPLKLAVKFKAPWSSCHGKKRGRPSAVLLIPPYGTP